MEGEVIGLIPEAACERESEWMRQLIEFDPQTKISGAPSRDSTCMAGRGIAVEQDQDRHGQDARQLQ